MESINIIKGYNKVDPSEDQIQTSHHPTTTTTQKRRPAVAISLIILLTVIIGAMAGVLIHETITEPPEKALSSSSSSLSANSADSLKTICSVTQYPNSCFTSVSSLIATNPTFKTDPELVFNLSIQVTVKELANLTSLPKTLLSKSNDPSTESALKDCMSLFDDALSQLNKSTASMEVNPGERVLTEAKIGDLNTWISSAMSDEETCLDGLEEMGSTMVDEVRTKVQKSKEYMSNSLAILVNIQSLLDKFDLRLH